MTDQDHDTEPPSERITLPPEEPTLSELAWRLEQQLAQSNELALQSQVASARCSNLCVELIARLQRDESAHIKLAQRVTYLEQLAGVVEPAESGPP